MRFLARVRYALPVYVFEGHDDSDAELDEHHDVKAEPQAVELIEVAPVPPPRPKPCRPG